MRSYVERIIEALALNRTYNWQLIDILAFIERNASWRAESLYVEGFEDSDEFNKNEYKHSNYEHLKALAKFLRVRLSGLFILKATVDFFGDEGGPAITITLVDEKANNVIVSRIAKDELTIHKRVLDYGVRDEKLYHIRTVAL